MTITESRLRRGRLTLGAGGDDETTFACQATNVRVTPSYDDDGDAVETLCGDSIAAGQKESWVLAGTSIQDFDDPEGFLAFCFDNRMTEVPFSWAPNVSGAPTWAGRVQLVALEEGGDVNTRLTTDWEFAVVGTPTRTYTAPAVPATGATGGTPGTFTPAGSLPPASEGELDALDATPATAWPSGQYVTVGGSDFHWDGDSWEAGRATTREAPAEPGVDTATEPAVTPAVDATAPTDDGGGGA